MASHITTPAAFASRVAEVAQNIEAPDLLHSVALLAEREAKSQVSDGPDRAYKTGTLLRSVAGEVRGADSAIVGTNVEYARYVHDGTKWMRARPFLKDAIEALRGSGRLADVLKHFGATLLERLTG